MRAALLALFMLCAGRALADVKPRIIIVADEGSRLAERVRTELETLGVAARIVRQPSLLQGESLSDLAWRELATLAVMLEEQSDVVRVATYGSERPVPEGQITFDAHASQAVLAIRIVEFLRASLIEPSSSGSPSADAPALASEGARTGAQASPPFQPPVSPAPQTEPSAPTAAVPRPPSARAEGARAEGVLALGGVVFGSPGDFGPTVGLLLSVGGVVARAVRVCLQAYAPLSANEHHGSEGSSRSRITWLSTDARAEFRAGSALRPSLGGGVGVAILTTEGRKMAPDFVDYHSWRITPGAYLQVGAGYYFLSHFALRVDVTAGAQLSRFVLTYAEREVAHWGPAWFAGSAGIELRLP